MTGIGDMSELYDFDDEEDALTESDHSRVIKRAELPRKPIEFFSG